MLLRIFFSLSFLLIPAHCLAEMPNSFEATVIADKSDYEGTLTWNGPDSGNEYWITDGSLNDERSVVYQALATENYRPRHYQHTEGVYEDVDDPTRALQDPTISEYFYVTHDVEKIANTTIAVGYDGTNLVLPVNEFQGFMLLSEPSEAIGSRPHFWTREADGQWTPK